MEYRLAVLREIFPEAFTEGSFDVDFLAQLIDPDHEPSDADPKGLRWPGRDAAIRSLKRPPASALQPVGDLVGHASHVFITGDNYEVLKILQTAYGNTVKMAFVEPPYNNSLDELYVDDFDQPWRRYASHTAALKASSRSPALASSASRGAHSRWLTMLLPRLYVARNLLRDDGVIFVAIDDHESQRLRFLMDEVFGPENFVCTFVWEKRYSPAPDAENVGYVHEYVLCYRKSSSFGAAFLPMSDDQRNRYQNPDCDERGPWKSADYTCRFTADERPNLFYPITHPTTGEEVWPRRSRVWACTREEHERQNADGRVWWGMHGENTVPARKAFLSEIRQGLMPASLLKHTEVGHTDDATKEIRQYFPDINFTPKPVALMKHLMSIAGVESGDIVLDLFARVGTTGEAVIEKCLESGADIRLVCIGLPEPVAGAGSLQTLPEVALARIERCLERDESGSQRLRVFEQRAPVLYGADDAGDEEGEGLQYFDPEASKDTLAANIALAYGLGIDGSVERIDVAGGIEVYVFNGELAVCVSSPLTADAIDSLGRIPVQRIVCLEASFDGQDELLLNARLALKDRGIPFETH